LSRPSSHETTPRRVAHTTEAKSTMTTIHRVGRLAAIALVSVFVGSCNKPREVATKVAEVPGSPAIRSAEPARPPIVFRSQQLPFTYFRGDSGDAWPVEATGGGVGLIDFDRDGDLDLFFAQGVQLPVGKVAAKDSPADVLLRNDGQGQFVDISKRVGLSSKGYGQGVTVADFDGDGDADVYVTRYDRNTLWRNDNGMFTDVTDLAGVAPKVWSLGAAFLDYDCDGDLDLYVAAYFGFNPKDAPFDRDPATHAAIYAMPSRFGGQSDLLYRNNGDGTFTDVSKAAGIVDDLRGMGVITADMDGDGRVDIFVANDAQNNSLWRNKGDGTFENVAETLGIAVNAHGIAEANMGIAHGDTDGDTLPDILISHFYDEHHTLWRPRDVSGRGWFYQDQTAEAGLAIDSRPLTGWGVAFADFDQDGQLDLIVTNGHIRHEVSQTYKYENPPILWQNRGGRFRNVTASGGPYFQSFYQGRGLAVGDLDGDGNLDVVVVHHHTPSVILWNETLSSDHWLRVRLTGAKKNRDAIGARILAKVGDRSMVRTVDGGGSYLSSNESVAHFGLGSATKVDALEVRWPSGKVETKSHLPADTLVEWAEAH
jgi:hypothetical protein